MNTVSKEQVRQFQDNGYIVWPNLFSADAVAEINANLLRLLDEASEDLQHPTPGMIINYEEHFEHAGKSLAGKGPRYSQIPELCRARPVFLG